DFFPPIRHDFGCGVEHRGPLAGQGPFPVALGPLRATAGVVEVVAACQRNLDQRVAVERVGVSSGLARTAVAVLTRDRQPVEPGVRGGGLGWRRHLPGTTRCAPRKTARVNTCTDRRPGQCQPVWSVSQRATSRSLRLLCWELSSNMVIASWALMSNRSIICRRGELLL